MNASFRPSVISPGILGKKADSKVLILGPYRSNYSRKLLRALRECLKRKGYDQASLVEDVLFRERRSDETTGVYYLSKSQHAISNWAQVLLFVFPRITRRRMDYSGVILEFVHMIEKAGWLLETSTAFFEEKDFQSSSLTLTGKIQLSHVGQEFFAGGRDLCKKAQNQLVSHLRSLY